MLHGKGIRKAKKQRHLLIICTYSYRYTNVVIKKIRRKYSWQLQSFFFSVIGHTIIDGIYNYILLLILFSLNLQQAPKLLTVLYIVA